MQGYYHLLACTSPNIHAIITSIVDGKTVVQLKWMRHATSSIKPALGYYSEHLKADHSFAGI